MILEIELYVCLGLLVYAWVVFPLVLSIAASMHSPLMKNEKIPSPHGGEGQGEGAYNVSILIAAHNEEDVIGERFENLVETVAGGRSPVASVRVLLGVDGSADRTAQIAEEFASKHSFIHVHDFRERRGKVAVLKEMVEMSRGERAEGGNLKPEGEGGDPASSIEHPVSSILVFTDANTMFKPDTLPNLLKHFSDPKIGGVCGKLTFVDESNTITPVLPDSNTPSSENIYWDFETRLKTMESALDSCLGANGAVYAIRKELFWHDIPANTIVDDLVIGMKIREQGYRMVYEPAAVAEEVLPEKQDEWRRRVRIGAGDFQALVLCRKCLLPSYGLFSWVFWSHKVLRWFTGHIGLFLVLGSWFLVWRGWGMSGGMGEWENWRFIYWVSLAVLSGTALALILALLGRIFRRSKSTLLKPFRIADYFVTMQAALLVGFLKYCLGDLKGQWERTPRGGGRAEG